MSVQSVIQIFDSFNTFLQAEEPLIYILYHSTLCLYHSLPSRFIISELDDLFSIDLEDPDVLKDFKSRFIGAMTRQFARDSDMIATTVQKILERS